MKARKLVVILGLLLLLGIVAVIRLLVGGESLGWPDGSTDKGAAIQQLRLLRLAAGVTVGAGLGVAGVLLQSLLRNPLASPDLLGLSSGSTFAVMLATYLNYKATGSLALWGGTLGPALIGAIGALVLVYLLSQRKGIIEPVSMILVGVVISVIFGAATRFCQTLMPDQGRTNQRWMMGAIDDNLSGLTLAIVGGVVVLATIAAVVFGRSMDIASLSDDEARSTGVSLGRLRTWQFLAAGAITAGTVVIAGTIGFVGLICPHLVRLLAGPGHGRLVVGSFLAGAALIVGADALVMSGLFDVGAGRVPIGVLTALIGGPVFLIMLRRQRIVGALN